MRITVAPPTFAWQPLTPRGVAAFARAPLRRLLLFQFITALLAASTIAWFLHDVWFFKVQAAIRQMPAQGEIRSGKLAWRGESPTQLAGDRFLTFVVDLNHEGEIGHEADVCVEFGQTDAQFRSLLGYWAVEYPKGWVIAFNRAELEPKWGAWEPAILAITILVVVPWLMFNWAVLATAYCSVAWLIAFFTNRELSWRGAWKLSAAALMPAALVMMATIFLYGTGALDVPRMGVGFGLHLVAGWVYVLVSPLFCPRVSEAGAAKGNPFVARSQSREESR